jgi:hypothetical protein
VERVKGNGYRARSTEPFALTARGATREEALDKLRARLLARFKEGTEVVGLELGPAPDPWLEFAGMFRGDPWIEDWKASVREYRQKIDRDAGSL